MSHFNESLRTERRALFSFGLKPTVLDEADLASATTSQRIESVWPYVSRCVLAFERTLSVRERANFDGEDICQEIFVALAERDHKWAPERGRYVTFCAAIIARELEGIRDRSRTIEAPRNSSCRVKAYRKAEETGTLSERCRATARDIERTRSGTFEVDANARAEAYREDDPASLIVADETAKEAADAIKLALASLEPTDAEVLRRMAGVDGCASETAPQIALSLGRTDVEVRASYLRARAGVRHALIRMRHPACQNLRRTG